MKMIALLLALICLNTSRGQLEYQPLPETAAVWIQTEYLYFMPSHEHTVNTTVVYTQDDTLIGGQLYRKFGMHGISDWANNWGSQQNFQSGADPIPYHQGFFRQDIAQKKVFLWDGQTDQLLYDFGNLVIGQPYPETVTNYNYPYLLVMGMDSVQLMDGNYYRRWALGTDSSDSAYVSVIEGVGGTNGFNTPIYPLFEHSSALLCHKTEAQPIYENWSEGFFIVPRYSEDCSITLSVPSQEETNLVIYPNPANTSAFIQSDQIIKRVEIYNLSGQSLLHQEISSNGKEVNLDLSVLEQGTYMFKIASDNGFTTMRQVQVLK